MNKASKKDIIIISLVLIAALAIILVFRNNQTKNVKKDVVSDTGFYFDTVVSITLYEATDAQLDECFKLCEKYENMFSNTISDSDVSKITSAANKSKAATVSDETVELIDKAINYSEFSDGKFDITVGNLTSLWDFDNNTGTIPDEVDISKASDTVNYKNIEINGNTVKLNDTLGSLDLGGIAKGYVADKIKEYCIDNGIKNGIINLGGNILLIGDKDGENYSIGIQKPFDENGETLVDVSIADKSLVTSGNYQRYFEKNGKIYHHILSTSTGYPVKSDLYSVTVISDKSVDGDALSTICFIYGYEKANALINELSDVEAIFVDDSYNVYLTDGLTYTDQNKTTVVLKSTNEEQ